MLVKAWHTDLPFADFCDEVHNLYGPDRRHLLLGRPLFCFVWATVLFSQPIVSGCFRLVIIQIYICPGTDVEPICCVLGMMLNSSFVSWG